MRERQEKIDEAKDELLKLYKLYKTKEYTEEEKWEMEFPYLYTLGSWFIPDSYKKYGIPEKHKELFKKGKKLV